jgi:hypothetical protein
MPHNAALCFKRLSSYISLTLFALVASTAMKKLGWSIMIMLGGSGLAQAQQSPTSFRVKSGGDALKVIPAQHQYRYPAFQKGKVVYMNGSFAEAPFNYNLLLGEVQFINPKGDTLALDGEATLHSVLIGDNPFIFSQDNGFLEVVANYNIVSLGKSQNLELAGAEKEGAYNQSSGASSIRTKSSYVGNNSKGYKLEQKGDVVFTEKVSYFLIDQRNQFYPANKSNVLKMFPKHRKAITAYLKEHSLDFKKEEELKELLRFCAAQEV